MKITYCIPSKNNLRYLKSSIDSIKTNSTLDYNIIVYVDADSDNTEQWLISNEIYYLKNETDVPRGIAYGYNRCIEAATTDVVCMFHADMYMAKGFDVNIIKHLKPKTVVAATRIEPPLHPPGQEKIVQDFGMYPEDFKLEEFNSFVEKAVVDYKDQVTYGIFAPWLCYKEELMQLNLHDEYFHSYHEDSDLFNRMILSGMTCVQSRDSFVYHFTCRGGQFQDGIEQVTNDPAFHLMKHRSARHYLRKWGSWIANNEYHHPITAPKYDVGFWVENCNQQALEFLEPWCSTIYTDQPWADYIEQEQPNTAFDLSKRVMSCVNRPHNDIVVYFDAAKLTQQSVQIIQQLSQIIKQSGEVGRFELDVFQIEIKALTEYQNNLIVCNTSSSFQATKSQTH